MKHLVFSEQNNFNNDILIKVKVVNFNDDNIPRIFFGSVKYALIRTKQDDWEFSPVTYFNGEVNTFGEVIVPIPKLLCREAIIIRARDGFVNKEFDYIVPEENSEIEIVM